MVRVGLIVGDKAMRPPPHGVLAARRAIPVGTTAGSHVLNLTKKRPIAVRRTLPSLVDTVVKRCPLAYIADPAPTFDSRKST